MLQREVAVKQCHAECNAHSAATSSHDQTVLFLLPFTWPNSRTSMATLLECHFQVSATAVQPDSARRAGGSQRLQSYQPHFQPLFLAVLPPFFLCVEQNPTE